MRKAWIIDFAERAFVVALAVPFMAAFLSYSTAHPYVLLLACMELATAVMILIRRPGEAATAPWPVFLAFAGTGFPLFVRPGGTGLIDPAAALSIMGVGATVSFLAKLFLNRSFGIIAANRGTKTGGPYRFVRHPMYAGYFVTHVGFVLANASAWNVGVYLIAWTLLVLRIREEEAMLLRDPAYRRFAERVRWRVVPGLY
ncbi:methyltransferase family protein [Sphingomonas lenta]|nr:isoprenylcysteine carboxylmethyltransferase family protein [Sphingomonas lenta]